MESTLAITLADLKERMLFQCGYTSGESEDAIVADAIVTGLHWYYAPPALPAGAPGAVSHNWSFLKPVGELTIADGEQYALLPADFGGFEGPLYVTSPSSSGREVPLIGSVMKLYADAPTATGLPQYAEEEPLRHTTKEAGQRKRLHVFPELDQDVTLKFRYYFHPNALTAANPYVYGGPQHAGTVVAACLAAVEMDVDGEKGRRWDHFMERLVTSISIDRRNRPQTLGYNADFAPTWHGRRPRRTWGTQETITVGGVSPE